MRSSHKWYRKCALKPNSTTLSFTSWQCSLERDNREAYLSSSSRAFTSTAASSTPTLIADYFVNTVEQSPCRRTEQQCPFAMHTNKSPSTTGVRININLWKRCKYTSYQQPLDRHTSIPDNIPPPISSIMCTTLQIGSLISLMVTLTYSKIIIMARSTLSHRFNRTAFGNDRVLNLCPRRIW